MMKAACVIVGVGVIVSLGLVIDADSRPQPTEILAPTDVATASIHASGRIEGVTEEIGLRPELHARVVEIKVHEGQRVKSGDALICLDGVRQQYELAKAEAELAAAEADLERLTNGAREEERREAAANMAAIDAQLAGVRQQHARVAALRQKGATTAQEIDQLTADVNRLSAQLDAARARQQLLEAPAREDELQRARAEVAAAQAQLELAKHERDKATLRAPFALEVLKLDADLGELVAPDAGQPALIVADTSKLFARAYIDEFDAPRVQLGMRARVSADGLPGVQARGRVVRMAPRMSRKPMRTDDPAERFDTKVREVWVELEEIETARLVIGLPVDVALDVAETTAATEQGPRAAPSDSASKVGNLITGSQK